jgi:predicted transcriptional regulator
MSDATTLTVSEVVQRLGLGVAAGEAGLHQPVTGALVCDLLSHVMAKGRPGQLWMTIQTHPNVVAVAALARLSAILVVGGFAPEQDTAARADEEGIPLLTSQEDAYTLAGRLYELGVR